MSTQMISTLLGDGQVSTTHEATGSTIVTDLPLDNGGKGRTFSPTDLLGASLTSCILTIMEGMAAKENLSIVGTKLNIEKVMGGPPRRVSELNGLITFPPHLTRVEKDKLLLAIKACPVHRSLSSELNVTIKEL